MGGGLTFQNAFAYSPSAITPALADAEAIVTVGGAPVNEAFSTVGPGYQISVFENISLDPIDFSIVWDHFNSVATGIDNLVNDYASADSASLIYIGSPNNLT